MNNDDAPLKMNEARTLAPGENPLLSSLGKGRGSSGGGRGERRIG